jgi:ligand-binding SRPBCC domain-containing protein
LAKTYTFAGKQWVPQPLDVVFDFFSRPANLQSLTPPWLDFHITEAPEELRKGSLIRYRLRIHKIPVRWTTEIVEWNPPQSFVDLQIAGPYKLWRHRHSFAAENGGTTIEDRVQYSLPFDIVGEIAHWAMVQSDVRQIFAYREHRMKELFGS